MNTQSLPAFTSLPLEQFPLPRPVAARPVRWGIAGLESSPTHAAVHVARHLKSLGANLVALADADTALLQPVFDTLQAQDRPPALYQDLDTMLGQEELDAVALCSSKGLNRQQLRVALDHGVHVLCEKPLLLEAGRDPVSDARPLVEAFASAGKTLMLLEPWPFTLRYFDELYPEARVFCRPPEHLAMLLCPARTGLEMVACAVPHALSLLFALCPPHGAVERVRVQSNDSCGGTPTALTISLQYVHRGGRTNVSLDLCHMAQSPQPAGYSIDGRSVRRVVQMPGYQTCFVAHQAAGGRLAGSPVDFPARRVPITDPLRLLLEDFQERVQHADRSPPAADETLLERLSLLRTIYAVARTSLS